MTKPARIHGDDVSVTSSATDPRPFAGIVERPAPRPHAGHAHRHQCTQWSEHPRRHERRGMDRESTGALFDAGREAGCQRCARRADGRGPARLVRRGALTADAADDRRARTLDRAARRSHRRTGGSIHAHGATERRVQTRHDGGDAARAHPFISPSRKDHDSMFDILRHGSSARTERGTKTTSATTRRTLARSTCTLRTSASTGADRSATRWHRRPTLTAAERRGSQSTSPRPATAPAT